MEIKDVSRDFEALGFHQHFFRYSCLVEGPERPSDLHHPLPAIVFMAHRVETAFPFRYPALPFKPVGGFDVNAHNGRRPASNLLQNRFRRFGRYMICPRPRPSGTLRLRGAPSAGSPRCISLGAKVRPTSFACNAMCVFLVSCCHEQMATVCGPIFMLRWPHGLM